MFSTFVELAFPQNGGYQPAEIKDMMDAGHARALVSSLDYFLLAVGFIIPYILDLLEKFQKLLYSKITLFFKCFWDVDEPFKILQEIC